MPVGFPVSPFFTNAFLTQPATLTTSGGVVRDVNLILDRDYEDTSVGDTDVINERPIAHIREEDVQDVTNGATLAVHDYITDESDIPLTDDSGEQLVAENVKSYKITRVRRTNDGVATLDLRTD